MNPKSQTRITAETMLSEGARVTDVVKALFSHSAHTSKEAFRISVCRWKRELNSKTAAPVILNSITRETWQDSIPDGEEPTLTSRKLNGIRKLAILSDIHFPYHDKEALLLALQWLRKFEPDAIILNGDIADFYPVNRFMVKPNKPSLKFEFEVCQAFFKQLRYLFKGANIYFKQGNHELRLQHFIYRNAAALDGVVNFDKLMDFKNYGIIHIDNNKFVEVGKLKIAHGHEIYGGAGAINVAKVVFDRAMDNIVCGHFHRTQEFIKKDIGGDVKGAWVTGCLQNLTVDYMPNNQWNHGFAAVEFDKSGAFQMHNKKIINGRVL